MNKIARQITLKYIDVKCSKFIDEIAQHITLSGYCHIDCKEYVMLMILQYEALTYYLKRFGGI